MARWCSLIPNTSNLSIAKNVKAVLKSVQSGIKRQKFSRRVLSLALIVRELTANSLQYQHADTCIKSTPLRQCSAFRRRSKETPVLVDYSDDGVADSVANLY